MKIIDKILDRKVLCIANSLKEQGDIRFILGSNQIRYHVKTVDKNNPAASWRAQRAKDAFGAPRQDPSYQYVIYVRAKDYKRARKLIVGNKKTP